MSASSSYSLGSRHGGPEPGRSTTSPSASFPSPHSRHHPLTAVRPSYGFEFFQSSRGTNVMLNWIEYAYDSCYGPDTLPNLYPGSVEVPATASPAVPTLPSRHSFGRPRHNTNTPQSQITASPVYDQDPVVYTNAQILSTVSASQQTARYQAMPFRPHPCGTASRHTMMTKSSSDQQLSMTNHRETNRETRYTNRSLHFSGLPYDYVDEDVFKAMLSHYGRVERCHINICKSGRPYKCTGVAIATFADGEAAADALRALNGRNFPGKTPRRVTVKWDKEGGELSARKVAGGGSGGDRDKRRKRDEWRRGKTNAQERENEQDGAGSRGQRTNQTSRRPINQPVIVDGTGKYGTDEETEVGDEPSSEMRRNRVADGKRDC